MYQQFLLTKQSFIVSFIMTFYKRSKQVDALIIEGKILLETIVDYTYQISMLKLKQTSAQQLLQKQMVNLSIEIIQNNIQDQLVKFSNTSSKFIQQISNIRLIVFQVENFLKNLDSPFKLLKQQTNSKTEYIQGLFELLVMITQYCNNYQQLLSRTKNITTLFQNISVSKTTLDQNILKYYLLIWVHQPLLKETSSFNTKYANLNRLKNNK